MPTRSLLRPKPAHAVAPTPRAAQPAIAPVLDVVNGDVEQTSVLDAVEGLAQAGLLDGRAAANLAMEAGTDEQIALARDARFVRAARGTGHATDVLWRVCLIEDQVIDVMRAGSGFDRWMLDDPLQASTAVRTPRRWASLLLEAGAVEDLLSLAVHAGPSWAADLGDESFGTVLDALPSPVLDVHAEGLWALWTPERSQSASLNFFEALYGTSIVPAHDNPVIHEWTRNEDDGTRVELQRRLCTVTPDAYALGTFLETARALPRSHVASVRIAFSPFTQTFWRRVSEPVMHRFSDTFETGFASSGAARPTTTRRPT